LGRGFFQIGELQFELIKQRAALRGLAELLAPQLPDGELELLEQERPGMSLSFRSLARRALGDEHSLQHGHIAAARIADDGITPRGACPPRLSRVEPKARDDQPGA
jgi:hypothetical protein